MNRNNARARGRRSLGLEILEGRELLSHVPKITRFLVPSPQAPLPAVTAVHGDLNLNRASSGLLFRTPPGRLSYSGNGTSTPASVGNLTFGMQQQETPTTTSGVSTTNITLGRAVLTDMFGEQVQISYNGQIRFPRHARHTISLAGTITGGTGRFENAGGTFAATGAILNANSFHLKFTLVPRPR